MHMELIDGLGEGRRDVCINQRSTIVETYGTKGYKPRISRYMSEAVGLTMSKDDNPPHHQPSRGDAGWEEAPLNRYDLRVIDRRTTPPRHAIRRGLASTV